MTHCSALSLEETTVAAEAARKGPRGALVHSAPNMIATACVFATLRAIAASAKIYPQRQRPSVKHFPTTAPSFNAPVEIPSSPVSKPLGFPGHAAYGNTDQMKTPQVACPSFMRIVPPARQRYSMNRRKFRTSVEPRATASPTVWPSTDVAQQVMACHMR